MRASLLFLMTVAVLWASGARAAGDDAFQRGNGLYAAGKYAEAAAAYESGVNAKSVRANLFYNLGDAYYRAGNRGRAILNYRRALLLEPAYTEARSNLAFVGAARPAETGTETVDVLSWSTAGAGWLTGLGVLGLIFQRRRRGVAVVLTVVGLLGVAGGVGTLWWLGGGVRDRMFALVVADGATARYSPADNSRVITNLPVGTDVRVLSAQGAWIYVALADGARGWVASDKVERLVPAG